MAKRKEKAIFCCNAQIRYVSLSPMDSIKEKSFTASGGAGFDSIDLVLLEENDQFNGVLLKVAVTGGNRPWLTPSARGHLKGSRALGSSSHGSTPL